MKKIIKVEMTGFYSVDTEHYPIGIQDNPSEMARMDIDNDAASWTESLIVENFNASFIEKEEAKSILSKVFFTPTEP